MNDKMACPTCGQVDKVQLLSAFIESENRVFLQSYPTPLGYKTKRKTELSTSARRLLSPPKPNRPTNNRSIWGALIVLLGTAALAGACGIFMCGFIGFFLTLFRGEPLDPLGLLFYAGVGLVILLSPIIIFLGRRIYRNTKPAYQSRVERFDSYDQPRWERALRKWKELYYCSRDDVLFVPGTGVGISPANLTDYLYSE
jgi:hypothetical protein